MFVLRLKSNGMFLSEFGYSGLTVTTSVDRILFLEYLIDAQELCTTLSNVFPDYDFSVVDLPF